jgi:hypothetical protein
VIALASQFSSTPESLSNPLLGDGHRTHPGFQRWERGLLGWLLELRSRERARAGNPGIKGRGHRIRRHSAKHGEEGSSGQWPP